MSNYPKRSTKPLQRARKKQQSMNNKPSNIQGMSMSGGDIGLYANPQLTYCLARYMIGSVGEIYTNNCKCVGVIKAVAPNGNFGLKCVRTAQTDSEDGPFELEDEKIVQLADIKKIVIKNVNGNECSKIVKSEEISSNDINCASNNDPDTCLEHYFNSNEDAETCSLNPDDTFPPEAMFEINQKLFNVTSSYEPSLEGYTLPLDKKDPEFKAKEVYFSKIAQDIELGNNSTLCNGIIDEDVEHSEESRFSAVYQEGVPGRELKDFKSRRTFRSNHCVVSKDSEVPLNDKNHQSALKSPLVCSAANNIDVKSCTSGETHSENARLVDICNEINDDRPSSCDGLLSTIPISNEDSIKKTDSSDQHIEKKKFTLDPNAPEFKPGQTFSSIDLPLTQHNSSVAVSFAYGYSQPIHCVPMPGISNSSQTHMVSGSLNSSTIPFCLPSSVSYVVSPNITQQIPANVASYRQSQPGIYSQLPISVAHLSQPSNFPSKSGVRQNLVSAGYSRQHSVDQPNQIPQMSFPICYPQNNAFSLLPNNAHPSLNLQFLATPSPNILPQTYSSLPSLTNVINVSQSSGYNAIPNQQLQPAQSLQIQPNLNSQPPTSIQGQSQISQFHPCYPHPVGTMPTSQHLAAYAAQYQSGSVVGSHPPGVPSGFSFYPPTIYQTPNLMQIPINGQTLPHQPVSQIHHPNQPTIGLPHIPLHLQPQNQTNISGLQGTSGQSHVILANQQYQMHANPFTQQMLAANSPQLQAVVAMMATSSPQAIQNALNSQNLHSQQHSMPIYLPQQPNNAG